MVGTTDIEISVARLDSLGPATKRVRDEADQTRWVNDPGWPARSLTALAGEDRELSAQEADHLANLHADGENPDRDSKALIFRATRLRLRETIAEISGIALDVCLSSPSDRSAAQRLFQLQRAEFWSLRTGYGAYRETLSRLPRPRGRELDQETLDREADVLAALAMADSDQARAACLEAAAKAGLNAEALKVRHEGRAVVEEALQEEVDRRVIRLREEVRRRVQALQAEKARDPVFCAFLLNEGWLGQFGFYGEINPRH